MLTKSAASVVAVLGSITVGSHIDTRIKIFPACLAGDCLIPFGAVPPIGILTTDCPVVRLIADSRMAFTAIRFMLLMAFSVKPLISVAARFGITMFCVPPIPLTSSMLTLAWPMWR
jgi:hypothetical protein